MTYARSTIVTEAESQAEIRSLLEKHGAEEIEVGLNGAGNGVVKFTLCGRHIRMLLFMPAGEPRERPRRWRVMVLLLKAKLEAVASGLSSVDSEFLAHIAMPGGHTVGSIMVPKVSAAYAAGRMLEASR